MTGLLYVKVTKCFLCNYESVFALDDNLCTIYVYLGSRDSAVGIETDNELDNKGVGV
jgi:hypothetical protein